MTFHMFLGNTKMLLYLHLFKWNRYKKIYCSLLDYFKWMIAKHWPLQLAHAHYHYEIARRFRATTSDLCYSISKRGNWPLNLLFSLLLVETYVVLCMLVPAWDAGVPVHFNLHQVLLVNGISVLVQQLDQH